MCIVKEEIARTSERYIDKFTILPDAQELSLLDNGKYNHRLKRRHTLAVPFRLQFFLDKVKSNSHVGLHLDIYTQVAAKRH